MSTPSEVLDHTVTAVWYDRNSVIHNERGPYYEVEFKRVPWVCNIANEEADTLPIIRARDGCVMGHIYQHASNDQ